MKESEAKEKWCPMVRLTQTEREPAFTNRGEYLGGDYSVLNCIANDCAVWIKNPFDEECGRCGLVRL